RNPNDERGSNSQSRPSSFGIRHSDFGLHHSSATDGFEERRMVPGGQSRAGVPPFWLFVAGLVGEVSQPANHAAVDSHTTRRNARAGWLVHEGHKLVGKAGHGAGDADAADVWAAADAVHPPALRHIAVDDRPPAADAHQALGRTVLVGEVALLVI